MSCSISLINKRSNTFSNHDNSLRNVISCSIGLRWHSTPLPNNEDEIRKSFAVSYHGNITIFRRNAYDKNKTILTHLMTCHLCRHDNDEAAFFPLWTRRYFEFFRSISTDCIVKGPQWMRCEHTRTFLHDPKISTFLAKILTLISNM